MCEEIAEDDGEAVAFAGVGEASHGCIERLGLLVACRVFRAVGLGEQEGGETVGLTPAADGREAAGLAVAEDLDDDPVLVDEGEVAERHREPLGEECFGRDWAVGSGG